MERDPRGFLWDACTSADAIARFVGGRSLQDYRSDEMLRAAVERHLEIIGEALSRLAKVSPLLAGRVPDLADAIAMRNILIHGYARIDDDVVWRTASEDVPALRKAIAALLDDTGGDGSPRGAQ
jgi:uncharacterized protein with HEPN domain